MIRSILTIVITLTSSAVFAENTLVVCKNSETSASISIDGNTQKYQIELDGVTLDTEPTHLGANTRSFISKNFARDVDLIAYTYRPGSLSADVVLELFEDDWNGIGSVYARFSNEDCEVNF